MRGGLALLLLCSYTCIAFCSSQAVSQPGSHPAAPAHIATDQRGRNAGPRGFQAALAARKDRRHKRHLEKLERQRDGSADQTGAAVFLKETAGVSEPYEEEVYIGQAAAEPQPQPQPQQIFPLIALAAAAFAAGMLLGYELGRARSMSPFDTPNQPITAVHSTSSGTPREEHEVSSSSPSMPALNQAISQASEKQELRLHARTAAAAIESSSEADPKLFASAAGMKDGRMLVQLPQAEHSKAREGRPSSQSESTGNGGADNVVQPQVNRHPAQTSHDSQALPLPDTTVLASSSATEIKISSGGQGGEERQHASSAMVLDSTETPAKLSTLEADEALSDCSAAASVPADRSSEPAKGIPAALEDVISDHDAHPESIDKASGRQEQGSASGQADLSSTTREPDMLQSMQWVASSSGGGGAEGRQRPEHWDRATAFWAAFTSKLDINTRDLKPGEKIQLAGVLLQAWTAFQQQSHHQQSSQLQEEANKYRAAAAAAAKDASAVKRARFQASIDAAQLARFQSALGDGLLFGIVVMLAAAAACAWQGGVADLLFGHCPAMSDVGTVSFFRPWAALDVLKVMGCWAAGVSDVLMASAVMLLVGRYLASCGALVGAHGAPLRKMALSLGAGCGAAGYFVVRRMRGNATRWLLGWELWVLLHLVVAWYMPRVLKALAAPKRLPLPGPGDSQGADKTPLQRTLSSAALPAYHVLMALLLPAAIGFAAFGSALQLPGISYMWH